MGPEQDAVRLREHAIKRLEGKEQAHELLKKDASELITELSIHQEELNIQNEELKRAQMELEASRARYFQLYDQAPVGYITLSPELVITDINQAASNLLGSEKKKIVNRGLSAFVSPQCQELLYLHFRRVATEGEQNHTINVLRNDGSEILVQFESCLGGGGPERGFRSILTDVTAVRRAEKDLKRSNAELQQFAYIASHDLQEPLRMVTAYLGLLSKKFGGDLSPQAKEYMSTAISGAERMRQLIDDLLQYSRIDAGNKEITLVDLTTVAENVKNDLHVAINEARAQVVIEPLPTVMADEAQMAKVLQNLLSNAIKFRGKEPPRIIVFAQQDDYEWVIAVKDNGIGIDPRYHDHLFEMFQRLHTQEEYPGTGIGLAISKKIVERHGGRIWVESDGKNGSIFYFTLPIKTQSGRELSYS